LKTKIKKEADGVKVSGSNKISERKNKMYADAGKEHNEVFRNKMQQYFIK